MRFLRRGMALSALVFGLMMLSVAPAPASGWSAIASTCALDDNAFLLPNGRLKFKANFNGGVFQFRPHALSVLTWQGEPLPITARCQVLNPYEVVSPAWGSFIVSYQDPDGPGAGARVMAKLIRVFRPDGTHTLATFDSNDYPATGAAFVDQVVTFTPPQNNFADSEYVVSINLYRTMLASNPRVLRVRLDE